MILPRRIAVIDIGKTNAKVALVDRETLLEGAVRTRPNLVLPGPRYPHFDIEGIWAFILKALSELSAGGGIDAISVTTHGACAALLAADGSLAAPVLDYEYSGPEETWEDYAILRPGFDETGSPRLPGGLNLGAQMHWLFARDAGLRDRVAQVVTWPQYWAHTTDRHCGDGRDLARLSYGSVEPASWPVFVTGAEVGAGRVGLRRRGCRARCWAWSCRSWRHGPACDRMCR